MNTSDRDARMRRGLRVRLLRWTIPGLALVFSGCAAIGLGRNDPFTETSRAEPVRLEIHNDHFNDARIYAHWGGQRQRVGTVVGKTSGTFEFNWRPEDFRVEVDFIAAGGFVTDFLVVWPGETVYLQIPPM